MLWHGFELLQVSITGFEHFAIVNIFTKLPEQWKKKLRPISCLKNIVKDSFDITNAPVNLVTLLHYRNLLFQVNWRQLVNQYNNHYCFC